MDCGDAPLTWLDNTVALKQLDLAHKVLSFSLPLSFFSGNVRLRLWQVISSRATNSTENGRTPRIVTLGGDHTTTLSALRSTYKHFGPVSVIHFDSHIGKRLLSLEHPLLIVVDTWDPEVLGKLS